MKNIYKILRLVILFCVTAFTINAQNSSLDNILKNYFDTIGQKKIVKIETAIATGVTVQSGSETSFKQIQKKPNKAYMEVLLPDGEIVKQGYDGETGWMLASWMDAAESVELMGPDLQTIKELGNIEGDLWNWKEKGHKLSLVGKEKLGDKEVYHLRLSKTDGDVDELFIDTRSYLLHKVIKKTNIGGSEVEVEIHYDDYRSTNGILLPFKVEQYFNNQLGMTVLIKEIKFGIQVDDNIFRKPD